ncbi:unnamed protein product [Soboliphyme baturini]|uniref:Zinc finger protein ZPR1 n=1 Tax=Soboliphyme baturini TaxID=241478 RepID=A0A183ICY7_9BILA|nr:unnamed protein product [Soboliphyme baturini]
MCDLRLREVANVTLCHEEQHNEPKKLITLMNAVSAIQGVTRLLLTKIPFYKEVILMSFNCEHCNFQNNEITFGGKYQEHGLKLLLKVQNVKDLDRQVVKTEYASVNIPEVDLEIPAQSHSGEITNVEGIVSRVAASLKRKLTEKQNINPDVAAKLTEFLAKLDKLCKVEQSFTLIIDDPSGNSFIESIDPSKEDRQLTSVHYQRSLEENKLLGLVADDTEKEEADTPAIWESREAIRNEVLKFQANCPGCGAVCQTNMKLVNIPYFKEVVIMATCCENCGYKSTEVKSGTGVGEKGMKLTLHVLSQDDLKRDVLKSETCSLSIPELELEVGVGILAGRFTTVEGLMIAVRDELAVSADFAFGDSATPVKREKMMAFLKKLEVLIHVDQPYHIVLDDPTGNSYIEFVFMLPKPNAMAAASTMPYNAVIEQLRVLGDEDIVSEQRACPLFGMFLYLLLDEGS